MKNYEQITLGITALLLIFIGVISINNGSRISTLETKEVVSTIEFKDENGAVIDTLKTEDVIKGNVSAIQQIINYINKDIKNNTSTSTDITK